MSLEQYVEWDVALPLFFSIITSLGGIFSGLNAATLDGFERVYLHPVVSSMTFERRYV